MAGLQLILNFYTEDPEGVGDAVNIFLFTDLSLSAISEATLVSRRWGTAPDSSPLVNFKDIASLLQRKKCGPSYRFGGRGDHAGEVESIL